MTDITELAQSHELLIANGQQTADLLRHLADNEIDSDYFAVVSECESYGKETDAELSITEFALRAAGYVDALVEALEKAQQHIARQEQIILNQDESLSVRRGELEAAQQERENWRISFDNERFRADKLKAHIDDIEPVRAAAEKLVRCKGRYYSEQNYRALAALFGVTTPDLPPLDGESRTVTVKPEDADEVREEGNQFLVVRHPGKVPVIKHPVGQLEDYLLQILKADPLATIDIVTHRYYGVGGQFVEDADEYLHEMGIKWEAE